MTINMRNKFIEQYWGNKMNLTTTSIPAIVKYKDQEYICYKVVERKCRLMFKNGIKFSGTPDIDNVDFIRKLKKEEIKFI